MLALASGVRDVARDAGPYLGGWHWQALATAAVEGVLVVAGSVWLVGLCERRLDGAGPRATRWSHAAFAAFVIQGPVLMAFASTGRFVPVPAEVKAPLVAAAAVAACFWIGSHLPVRPRPAVPGASTGPSRAVPPVHSVDFGGDPDGPDIVLVHGLGGSHLNWDLLAPRLTAHARVLAIDLPGFGMSEPSGRPATIRSNVAVLARFVRERCAGPAVVVGNSMGGLVSVLLAARAPELVRGLVLLDPALPAPGRVLRSPSTMATLALYALPGVGELVRRRRRRRIGAEATARETLDLCGVDPAVLPPELFDRSVALIDGRSDVAGTDRAFLSASRSLAWALARSRAYERAMGSITAPVLLLHGDQDRLVPVTAARAVAQRHPDWTYVEFAGCGHLPQLQSPDEVARHISAWLPARQSEAREKDAEIRPPTAVRRRARANPR